MKADFGIREEFYKDETRKLKHAINGSTERV